MKRAVSCLLCLAALAAVPVPAQAVSADSARSAVLIHADTGRALYEKNADERSLIASTTKIMTALVVVENCGLDEPVYIEREYTGIEGSSMYLEPGQTRTVRDLLYGLLLASGNDAAVALACHTAGSVEAFADMMNERAAELGLGNSSFKNPHGLDAEGHYSSARDLALITSEALENEDFAEIFATKSVTIDGQTYVNHNRLLFSYDGCIGGKPGYTIAAGRTLVSAAERDGLTLICVTISDPDDWNTHTRLLDWGFENYRLKSIGLPEREIDVPLISGFTDTVKAGCPEPAEVLVERGAGCTCLIELPPFVYAPVTAGDVLGKINVYSGGELLASAPIKALENAPLDGRIELSTWERFRLALGRLALPGIYYPAFLES